MPDLFGQAVERIASHDAQGDLVGQLFRLQIRMVVQDRDVTQFVRIDGVELILAERVDETVLD